MKHLSHKIGLLAKIQTMYLLNTSQLLALFGMFIKVCATPNGPIYQQIINGSSNNTFYRKPFKTYEKKLSEPWLRKPTLKTTEDMFTLVMP
jgi:hypothetical protein